MTSTVTRPDYALWRETGYLGRVENQAVFGNGHPKLTIHIQGRAMKLIGLQFMFTQINAVNQ